MLTTHDLTRRFGDVVAVDRVSMDVPDGRMTGFIGGNGAGKTTTMRMIMGVLAAQAGTVTWNGMPVTADDRRRFGYMPEERGLYPKQPILDQLTYLGQLKGMTAPAARTTILAYLDRFGLASRAKERVEKLSLGNQQRVQIVAALLGEPRFLVLDEPFSGLDPDAVDSMAEMLREHVARGIPVLFSSHQLDLVDRLCDRLVVMARGRVVAQGTSDDLRTAGPVRYHVAAAGDLGWVEGMPGIATLERLGATVEFQVSLPGAEQRVLAEAVRRGPIESFGRVIPPLSEIYRRVTAA